MVLTTRMLTPDSWEDFAALVESNNGVWGGCWCQFGNPPELVPKQTENESDIGDAADALSDIARTRGAANIRVPWRWRDSRVT